MTNVTLITLDDVTQSRATVTAVRLVSVESIAPSRETGLPRVTGSYAVLRDGSEAPVVGERIWVLPGSPRGEQTITARQ